jgi:hypothetical protein
MPALSDTAIRAAKPAVERGSNHYFGETLNKSGFVISTKE